jgi:hypothetical protein
MTDSRSKTSHEEHKREEAQVHTPPAKDNIRANHIGHATHLMGAAFPDQTNQFLQQDLGMVIIDTT